MTPTYPPNTAPPIQPEPKLVPTRSNTTANRMAATTSTNIHIAIDGTAGFMIDVIEAIAPAST